MNYNYEVTIINGVDIERYFMMDNTVIGSIVKYHGESEEDARKNFIKYWEAPIKY